MNGSSAHSPSHASWVGGFCSVQQAFLALDFQHGTGVQRPGEWPRGRAAEADGDSKIQSRSLICFQYSNQADGCQ